MTRRHALILALPLGLALVAGACGDDDDADDTDDGAASGLVSSGWILDNDSLSMEVPDTAEEITIAFTEVDVAGNSGCNNYTSTYTTTEDGGIAFDVFVTTRKACEPDVMAVETAYLSQLAEVSQYEIDGDQLVLTGAAGTELLHGVTEAHEPCSERAEGHRNIR